MNGLNNHAALPPMQGYPVGEPLGLRHHLNLLKRRWLTILAAVVIVVTLGSLYTFRKTPIYRASALLQIERTIPALTPFDKVEQFRDQNYLETQLKLITSKAVLEKALEDDRLSTIFTGEEDAELRNPGLTATIKEKVDKLLSPEPARKLEPWEQLRGAVKARAVPKTNLVEVSVESSNPSLAALVANTIARAYVAHSVATRQASAGEAFDMLQLQRREQEKALTQAEDALLEYRQKTAIPQLGVPQSESLVLKRLNTLSEEYNAIQIERIAMGVSAQAIEEELNKTNDVMDLMAVKEVREDPMVSSLYNQVVQLRGEMEATAQIFGAKHPKTVAVGTRVKEVEEQLRQAISQVADSVQAQYAMLKQREQELLTALQQQNQLALEAARKSTVYERLRREVDRQTRVFEAIVDRMKEVDLTKDTRITNVSLEQEAEVPRIPVSPNKKRALFLALFLGLIFGVAAAYGLEYLDDTVKSPDSVEHDLGVPWLGYVPRIRSQRSDLDGLAERARWATDHPRSREAEAFRSIRTNVYFSAPRGELKSLMITSAIPQEGKTVVAANFASICAMAGERVLLVDADLRRPMIHQALGLERKPGLSDVIVQGLSAKDVVQTVRIGLHVLTGGSRVPNPSELVGSKAAAELMKSLESLYDVVIYDAPPTLFMADTAPLVRHCSGTLLVVKTAKCRRSTASGAIKQIKALGGHFVGVVLNDVRPGILRAYGTEGYYYQPDYYRYYEERTEESEP